MRQPKVTRKSPATTPKTSLKTSVYLDEIGVKRLRGLTEEVGKSQAEVGARPSIATRG